jgi:ribosomal protein L23
VEENFDVKVGSVKTMNEKDLEKTNLRGKKRKIKGKKKAIVSLKGDKKIDIFDNA